MANIPVNQRAVGYFRVSDPKQTGERHSSLETQEAHFKQYCHQHSLKPTATFTDVVTGRRDDRKEYRRMVEFVLGKGADVVVVQFLDRFGRNPKEMLRRYWELQENDIEVVATDEDIGEELILLLKAGMAGAESRRTSERVRANMGRAVAKGAHAARAPYGLRQVRELKDGNVNLRWEIDPEEGPLVREMARLATQENRGYKAIGDLITASGRRARGGGPFAAYTVQSILTNPAITGIMVYGRRPRKGNPSVELVEVRDYFPAILSPEEWSLLRDRLTIRRENSRGQGHSSVYIMGGIARCGHCEGPMSGKTGAAYKGTRYRNYYCSRAMHSREQCQFYNGHSARKLEKAVLQYLGQFSDPELVREYLVAADREEVVKREAELRDIERHLSESEGGFLKRLDDLLRRNIVSESEFERANQVEREKNARLEARRAEVQAWLQTERDRTSLVEKLPKMIGAFLEAFDTLEPRQQKAHLQMILKAAYVFNDGHIGLEFRA